MATAVLLSATCTCNIDYSVVDGRVRSMVRRDYPGGANKVEVSDPLERKSVLDSIKRQNKHSIIVDPKVITDGR